jgi:flagellar protein FlaI
LFVEHKVFGSCRTTIEFNVEDDLNDFVIKLSERIGKPVSYRRPIVDSTLPDGSRINIVFGRDVSIRGSNFTIRKFSDRPLSIIQLCLWNTMDYLEAAYLWMLLEYGLSLWVCGETASGKTTTLKAIIPFIRPNAKIVSIEDTPEIICPHENWTREVTREGEDVGSSVEMFDLLRAALRQRPNYIIVGEIRGVEGSVAFQAMQTGHPVLATFHAASVEKLIQRLTGSPIDIPKTYIDNLNAVIIQSAVRLPQTGMVERRVISINEIVGYDPLEERFNFIELYSWEATNDSHIFRGEGMSYLLEEKIATMKGLPLMERRRIYEELFLRSSVLRLMAENSIIDYYDVWNALNKIYKIGVEEAFARLRDNGEL